MTRDPSTYRGARKKAARNDRTSPPGTRLAIRDLFGTVGMGIAVALLVAIGAVLITVDQFRFAEACFVVAGLWFIGWILFLPYYNTPFDNRKTASLWAFVLMTIAVVIVLVYFAEDYKTGRDDILTPGNEAADDRNCKSPNGQAVALYIGPHTFYIGGFPQRIITIANKNILTLSKRDNDIIITTLRMYDENGNIIARIDQNGFWVAPDVRKKKPDRHSLIVYDRHDDEVLNIKYLNPHAVYINGIFRYEGRTAMFTPTFFKFGGISGSGGACTTKELSFDKSIFNFD
jgi:hypothetical protein